MGQKCCPRYLRFPFRYYIMFLASFSAAFMFASRCIINVAILAMVTTDSPVTMDSNSSSLQSMNETIPIKPIKSNNAPTFNWNQDQQGIIIGSYFYSYTLMQISTGFLADKFDVANLTSISHLAVTLLTLLIPIATQTSYYLLIVIRILLGFFHAVIFPCCYIIFEKWFSPQEKAFAQSLMNIGTNIGVISVMPITAWLCENGFAGGWPSAFYSIAAANGFFLILWYTIVTVDPNKSSWISDEEKMSIAAKVVRIPKRKAKVPWKSILTSLPLWSVAIGRGVCSLGYQAINSKIPLYLETILGYQLKGNGLINAALYTSECAGQLISGPLSRFIASKGYLTLTRTRKLFESVALIGPTIFLMSTPLVSGKPEVIVIGLISTMFTMGFSVGGDTPIVPEMAPNLIGTIFGFANTISSAAGFLAPMSIGYILGDQIYSESKWNSAFFIFGLIHAIGLVLFNLFATSEPQPWALDENTTDVQMSTRNIDDHSKSNKINPQY